MPSSIHSVHSMVGDDDGTPFCGIHFCGIHFCGTHFCHFRSMKEDRNLQTLWTMPNHSMDSTHEMRNVPRERLAIRFQSGYLRNLYRDLSVHSDLVSHGRPSLVAFHPHFSCPWKSTEMEMNNMIVIFQCDVVNETINCKSALIMFLVLL